jgi:hypothetical protein
MNASLNACLTVCVSTHLEVGNSFFQTELMNGLALKIDDLKMTIKAIPVTGLGGL